jgi:short-subunit dehydrogenase
MSSKPIVLVTGASGGIGLELARLFARDRHPLAITARGQGRLDEVAEELAAAGAPRVDPIAADLGRAGGARELVAELAQRALEPGVVVNNAGYGLLGAFAEIDLDDELAMLQLNIASLVELTKRLLPGVAAAGRAGGLLNVASTAAFQPGPYMASYYASKAFVLSWSEALAHELTGTTRVTCLCPGPVPTGFQARAGFGDGLPMTSGALPMLSAAAVAKAGYAAFRRGKRVVVPGLVNKIGAAGTRLVPRGTAAKIAGSLQKRRERR